MRQAGVAKAQRDAVSLLQNVAVPGSAESVAKLQVPWPVTIARGLRRLLRGVQAPDANPEHVARQIVEFVEDEGLLAPPPPPPPVAIEPDDVHLVCFQVVSP